MPRRRDHRQEAAKAIDQQGHSADFRIECATSLYRTLWRLLDYAEDAGIDLDCTESNDSDDYVLFEKYELLAHLAKVANGLDDDDDETDDDETHLKRSTNGTH